MVKIACVTAIIISGETHNPNNYILISSLPILDIIFEKILHSRLTSFFETNRLCTNNQYSFRKTMSASNTPNELLHNIYKSMNEKTNLVAVFLDLNKAFYAVSHDILLKKIRALWHTRECPPSTKILPHQPSTICICKWMSIRHSSYKNSSSSGFSVESTFIFNLHKWSPKPNNKLNIYSFYWWHYTVQKQWRHKQSM